MKEYYVYMLHCSDNSYYIGVTNNLEERILQHQRGDDRLCYTYSRREVALVWFETFREINQAIEREKQIKGWGRKKKGALIRNAYEKLPDLAKNSYAKRIDGITLQLEKERDAILRRAQDDTATTSAVTPHAL